MFEIFAESYLPHQLVLVTVHASELPHMSECVLEAICQLERIHIAQPVLHVGINNQLRQAKNLPTKMKGIAKSTLLPFLGGKGFYRLKVEVIVQMKVIQVLAVDEKVQHVVALTTDLQTSFHPIQFSGLEEFGGFERPKQKSAKEEHKITNMSTYCTKPPSTSC